MEKSPSKDTGEAAKGDGTPESTPAGLAITQLLRLLEPQKGLVVLAVVCATLSALLSLVPYFAVALLLTELFAASPDWQFVQRIGLVALAAVVLERALSAAATTVSHTAAFSIELKLREDLADKLSRMPIGEIEQRPKGEIRTALMDDVETLEDSLAHLVPELIAAIVAPILILIGMFVLDWRLTLLCLLPMLLGIVLMGRMMKHGTDATQDYFRLMDRIATTAAEVADSLPTLRAFNQDGQAAARASAVLAEMTKFSNVWVRQAVAPGSSAQVLLSSHLLFVAPLGLGMTMAGWVSLPVLAAVLVIAYGLGDLFAAMNGISHRLTIQRQVLDRINALADVPELPAGDRRSPSADASLRFTDVAFAYGARQVLTDISFHVEPGRCVALVGPSGAGKSTIGRLAARFYDVSDGAIQIGGVDIRDLHPDDLYRQVAIVFQDVFLFRGTIADNIRLGRSDASDEDVVAAARSAQAHQFIMAFPQGYQTVVGELGAGLSGGERQRISIARALLKNAPILILDEATAFADTESEALIQKALAKLTHRRTVIVTAHRLRTISHADEILVLDQGRIVERGTMDGLREQKGLFARMWDAQEAVANSQSDPEVAT